MKTKRISIFYQGVSIGYAEHVIPDKWHMEGCWVGEGTSLAVQFEADASELQSGAVMQDYKRGVVIRCCVERGESYMAVVTSLADGVLRFMRFSSCEAVKWAEAYDATTRTS